MGAVQLLREECPEARGRRFSERETEFSRLHCPAYIAVNKARNKTQAVGFCIEPRRDNQ